MNRALAIALVLVGAGAWAADHRTPPKGVSLPMGCRNRSCVRGRVATVTEPPAPSFQTRENFVFGPSNGGPSYARPTFSGDANLSLLFYVNSDCTVSCVTDDQGTACPGVSWSGGTGATCQQIWTGDWSLTDITDAKAWIATGITRSPADLLTSSFSVSAFGYHTSKNSANPVLFEIYDGNTNGVWLRGNGSGTNATWFETDAFPSANTFPNTYDAFNLITAHRNNTGPSRNINSNGGSENSAVTTGLGTMVATGTIKAAIGRNPDSAGQANGGQFVWAAVYKSNKTTAQSNSAAYAYAGLPSGVDTNGTASLICFDKSDGGQNDCVLNGLPYIDNRGYRAWSGERTVSKWAADPLDVSSWTAINSPGVVSDVKAGPFYEWKHTPEMDRVIDTNAGAFVGAGMTGNGFVRAPSHYTSCVYLSAGDGGTSNKARIAITAANATLDDGGTEVDCDFSDLTPTPTLKSCTATVLTYDGGVTIAGQVLVGNAASDVGSITVGHARFNQGVACEPPVMGTYSVGNNYLSFDAGAWTSDSTGGIHEVVWIPLATAGSASSTNSPLGDWQEQADAIYLHDAFTGSEHIVTYLPGYNTSGHFLGRFVSIANGSTDLTLDGVNLVPGSVYAMAAKWVPTSGVNCALSILWNTCSDGTAACVATTTQASGAGPCPDQPAIVMVPQRYDATVPSDAWIQAMRNKTP